jgi:hypothetical protein
MERKTSAYSVFRTIKEIRMCKSFPQKRLLNEKKSKTSSSNNILEVVKVVTTDITLTSGIQQHDKIRLKIHRERE